MTILRRKLTGEVSPQEVEKNLMYYETYISDRVRQGKTEEEVLEELGSPLLIAKTIIDMNGKETSGEYEPVFEKQEREQQGNNVHVWHVGGWVIPVIIILVLLVLFSVLRILMPVLLPILVICFVISMFKKK